MAAVPAPAGGSADDYAMHRVSPADWSGVNMLALTGSPNAANGNRSQPPAHLHTSRCCTHRVHTRALALARARLSTQCYARGPRCTHTAKLQRVSVCAPCVSLCLQRTSCILAAWRVEEAPRPPIARARALSFSLSSYPPPPLSLSLSLVRVLCLLARSLLLPLCLSLFRVRSICYVAARSAECCTWWLTSQLPCPDVCCIYPVVCVHVCVLVCGLVYVYLCVCVWVGGVGGGGRWTIDLVNADRPWELYRLSPQHSHRITALRWNRAGDQLMSADENGTVNVWEMENHLANKWKCILSEYQVGMGESIVAMQWIQGCDDSRFVLPGGVAGAAEGKDAQAQAQAQAQALPKAGHRMYHSAFRAVPQESVSSIQNGWVLVTRTGNVVIMGYEPHEPLSVHRTNLLGHPSPHPGQTQTVHAADVAFSHDQCARIAFSLDETSSIIRVVDVYFNHDDRAAAIDVVVKPFGSIASAAPCPTPTGPAASPQASGTCLCFAKNQQGKTLFAAWSSGGGNVIRRFDMTVSNSEPIHKVFRKDGHESTVEMKGLHCVSEATSAVAVLELRANMDATKLIAVYADGNVKVHEAASLAVVWALRNTQTPESLAGDADRDDYLFRAKMHTPEESKRASKRLKLEEATAQVIGAQMSPHSGCLLVSSTKDGLSVYPIALVADEFLQAPTDPGQAAQLERLVERFEHALVCGADYWDLVASVRSQLAQKQGDGDAAAMSQCVETVLNAVIERLDTKWRAIDPSDQQFYKTRLLYLEAVLLRFSHTSKATELYYRAGAGLTNACAVLEQVLSFKTDKPTSATSQLLSVVIRDVKPIPITPPEPTTAMTATAPLGATGAASTDPTAGAPGPEAALLAASAANMPGLPPTPTTNNMPGLPTPTTSNMPGLPTPTTSGMPTGFPPTTTAATQPGLPTPIPQLGATPGAKPGDAPGAATFGDAAAQPGGAIAGSKPSPPLSARRNFATRARTALEVGLSSKASLCFTMT